ncbi:diguanylate cyclase [Cryobacterium levicorallinum]|uniref:Diguanylate cyclase n=1 Tax=Cryobacterium levicorallinum TaxID=995038 RepID=A0A1I2YFJ9_9MICO|nr:diguanylate cyclase [Cryobacterium levicorallinum]TFB84509.1 diguanylate cyclase [Cryobacterium levicorallinum]GEP28463.1 hypothetical protein CLE01_30610 [Cryobacterium levicorallinum]SFH24378.1 diguanylate cyclase (GGDEF) domain-containing protein [Cryobacterium levicorallinum]
MNLDSHTIQTMNGIVIALCAVTFTLNTAFKRNDTASRLWSLASIVGVMIVLLRSSGSTEPLMGWTVLAGNIGMIVAVSAVWSGARRFNRRRASRQVIGLMALLTLATVGATLAEGLPLQLWAGSVTLWLSVAILAVLGALEFVRGRLQRNLNGQIVAMTLAVTAVVAAVRAVVFLVDGRAGKLFTTYFATDSASAVSLCLVIIGTIALSVLRAEQAQGSAVGDMTDGIHSAAGVLSNTAFEQAATDHLDRGEAAGLTLALIGADIDNLPEINTAFGRIAGDEAIARFAANIRGSVPVMSLIGHRSSGYFQMLVVTDSAESARDLTEKLQVSLVEEPLREAALIRLTASFCIASTGDHGYSLSALGFAANAGIVAVKAAGGNAVALDPAHDDAAKAAPPTTN